MAGECVCFTQAFSHCVPPPPPTPNAAASATAAEDLPLHALNKLPYGKLSGSRIGVKEGIIFLTYSSLIASSGRSVGRSVGWLAALLLMI